MLALNVGSVDGEEVETSIAVPYPLFELQILKKWGPTGEKRTRAPHTNAKGSITNLNYKTHTPSESNTCPRSHVKSRVFRNSNLQTECMAEDGHSDRVLTSVVSVRCYFTSSLWVERRDRFKSL